MQDMSKYFHRLRHNKRHHLGLGDVRLTLAQQEALVNKFETMRAWIEDIGDHYDICTRSVLGKVCSTCRCGRIIGNAQRAIDT